MNNFAFVPALALPSSCTRSSYLCGSRVRSLRPAAPARPAPLRWVTVYACTSVDKSSVAADQDTSTVEVPDSTQSEPVQESVAEVAEEPVADQVADPVAEVKSEEPETQVETEETLEKPEPVVAEDASEPAADSSESTEKKPEDRRGKRMRRRRREVTLPLEKLEIGMELEGVVKSVTSYGAFIGDLGTPTDGLLHVSQLAAGYVENVTDVVQVGSKVKVRVTAIDLEKKNFSLTMKPPASENEENPQQTQKNRNKERMAKLGALKFDPSEFVDAKVTTIADFGAFCQLLNADLTVNEEVPTDGLIHISELSEKRVGAVSDVVKIGQVVKVRITSVDKKRSRISLSMKEERQNKDEDEGGSSGKSLAAEIAASNDSQPKFKTAFEIAFERAGIKLEA